ncbi:hypothetical protein [Corynebacterium ulcerans]|uniref:Secreted protein n=1 Tax=Corynebacterium ulcerans TaxID=65058 RepID=A0ABD0BMS6_CORUL|nr:hypothetical protein [Corynebacterium ulcerans]KPH74119.1 hypothetical protein AFK72_10380 [Corynebacterium ulcerans]MBL4944890.1 hypothetical protein [Corynebacterium ulcerans]OIS05707.1 hypothetical protein BHG00_08555 [Corynebacterium ulcerans]QGZ26346.1 hypothetical protein CpMRi49_10520 [Corynebacterium ulcerans]QOE25038.1 hypothetical protein HUF05_10775 [Corynebacterium ulcerans]
MSTPSRRISLIVSGILATAVIAPAAPALAADAGLVNAVTAAQDTEEAPKTHEEKLQEATELLTKITSQGGAVAYIQHEGEKALNESTLEEDELASFLQSTPDKEHAAKELQTAIEFARKDATTAKEHITDMLSTLTEQYSDAQTSKEEAFIQAAQKVQSAISNLKLSAEWLAIMQKVATHFNVPTDGIKDAFTPNA